MIASEQAGLLMVYPHWNPGTFTVRNIY